MEYLEENQVVRSGSIEVICGSMFSGKTEELLRRVKRARYARQRVELFKPKTDRRYDGGKIVSHDAREQQSVTIERAEEILLIAQRLEVIGIDEAQFFGDELVEVCNHLANRGIRVIVAGLDMDYRGRPFGPLPALMTTAEFVTKVHAICVKCGSLAHYSHRITAEKKLIVLGEGDSYEPLCRKCYAALFPPVWRRGKKLLS